ncbi:MAG: TolC family protein [Elusimicrobia bacterium]|nr:TolC family protein [Elusimicrobiota bacterium]
MTPLLKLGVVLCPAAIAVAAGSRYAIFSLTLTQAEQRARAHSPEVKESAEQAYAAGAQAEAQFGALLPRVTLDGYYRYQSAPLALPTVFNSERATAIGPSVSWTLWDQGALYRTWQAQKANAQSQDERKRLLQTQAVLGVRLAYVQVVLAREQVRLLAESVGVASAQHKDVQKRFRAGAASKIDVLIAHQAELERRKEFLTAQASLGSALRELFQLVGETGSFDLARPADARQGFQLPAGLPTPSLLVEVDPLTRVSPLLASAATGNWDKTHPELKALDRQEEAATLSARSIESGRWPKLQFNALMAYEYPNTQLSSVTQKAFSLAASVPLFEGRQIENLASRQKHLAAAVKQRRGLVEELLSREWDKAQLKLEMLREQKKLEDTRVEESKELAELIYIAYRAGRSTFLDVSVANLSALQAKIQTAQTSAQILVQLAQLAQLAGQG